MALGEIKYEEVEPVDIRFREELLLEEDIFNKPTVRKNLEALAQEIQNLIIFEPGTYPNNPELGVGIANYMYELLDQPTLAEISSKIEAQITKYITHQYILVNVECFGRDTLRNNTVNTIRINITLQHVDTDQTITLTQAISTDNKTDRLVSDFWMS